MKKYLLGTNICAYFLNGKYNLVEKFEKVGIEIVPFQKLP